MPVAVVNGVRVHYLRSDDGDASGREELVMVHGLATSLAFWYLQYVPAFQDRFRITLYDLRGHGRSEMTESGYTPQSLATDLEGLLDHLKIGQAHFLAHSFGGVVSMSLACRQPDRFRSLVLADTHISAVRHVETVQEWQHGQKLQQILDRHGLDLNTRDPYFGYWLLTRVAQWQLNGLTVPPELAQLAGPLMGPRGMRTASHWIHLMSSTRAEAELMSDDGLTIDRLRRFDFPIMAMYGDQSQARLTGAELLGVWPHAVFRRVRDAGHFFPTSKPEEVVSGCHRFWAGELGPVAARKRAGEGRRQHFRSDRVYQDQGQWWFSTREKERVGPFAAGEEARASLTRYLRAVAPA